MISVLYPEATPERDAMGHRASVSVCVVWTGSELLISRRDSRLTADQPNHSYLSAAEGRPPRPCI